MGGAYYIMLINVTLAVMLLFGFYGFWLYDKKRVSALFFFFATLCFFSGATMQLNAMHVPPEYASPARFILYAINFSAGMLLTHGVVLHYKLNPHVKRMFVVFFLGLLLTYLVFDLPRQSVLRLCLNQTPLVVAVMIGAVRIWGVKRKTILDKLLGVAFIVFALNLASRPLVLAIYGTMGKSIAEYHETKYALVVQFSLTVVTMSTATILMLVLIADVVAKLMKTSQQDPMTELLNRRGFDEHAVKTIEKLERSDIPCVFITCDIDHFKSINDRFGHDVGDKVISYFGRMLGNMARQSDLVARMGGEEFALMLWNCSQEDGYEIANDIRVVLNTSAVPFLPEGTSFSASFGIAAYQEGDTVSTLAKRSDLALYEAKQGGRNTVRIFHEEGKSEAEQPQTLRVA